jgi:hypothetical protein
MVIQIRIRWDLPILLKLGQEKTKPSYYPSIMITSIFISAKTQPNTAKNSATHQVKLKFLRYFVGYLETKKLYFHLNQNLARQLSN